MTILRKGSRKIIVDSVDYRWRVRRRPTYSQSVADANLTVAIDLADSPKCTLVIDVNRPHPSAWLGSTTIGVTPSEVASLIRKALADGWQPTVSGSPFLMSTANIA